jgi:hypothetical protein
MGKNSDKTALFSIEERMEMINFCCRGEGDLLKSFHSEDYWLITAGKGC